MFSLGAIRIEGIEGDTLIINSGERRTVGELVHFISKLSPAGYLFQRVLRANSSLTLLTGAGIASIRFLVLLSGGGEPVIVVCG